MDAFLNVVTADQRLRRLRSLKEQESVLNDVVGIARMVKNSKKVKSSEWEGDEDWHIADYIMVIKIMDASENL